MPHPLHLPPFACNAVYNTTLCAGPGRGGGVGGCSPASADTLTFSVTLFPLSPLHPLSYTSTYPQSCFCFPLAITLTSAMKTVCPIHFRTHQSYSTVRVHKHPVLSLVMRALHSNNWSCYFMGLPSLRRTGTVRRYDSYGSLSDAASHHLLPSTLSTTDCNT